MSGGHGGQLHRLGRAPLESGLQVSCDTPRNPRRGRQDPDAAPPDRRAGRRYPGCFALSTAGRYPLVHSNAPWAWAMPSKTFPWKNISGMDKAGGQTQSVGLMVTTTEGPCFTAQARLLTDPPLWCWEIVDASGALVASSWQSEWEAYSSAGEALRHALPALGRFSRGAGVFFGVRQRSGPAALARRGDAVPVQSLARVVGGQPPATRPPGGDTPDSR